MSWFSNLVHRFEHVLRHVAAIAGDVVAASFGFPPGAGFAAAELLMHAHAGDPHARAKVARLSQNPRMRAYLLEVSRHLRAHPDYATFRSHAGHGHPAPTPQRHGMAAAPLPPGAHASLAHGPAAAGLTTHSTWTGAEWEVGRAQIVGEDPFALGHEEIVGEEPYSTGRAQIVGEAFVGADGHHAGDHGPRHHRHPHGHGPQARGIEWLLGEQEELDRMTSPYDGEPEEWQTPRAPLGTPGI
jgi:hypothetical protein